MAYEYLKSDTQRVERKIKELDKKFQDLKQKDEVKSLESRYLELKRKRNPTVKDHIWADIYRDVMEIEKK